MSKLTKNLTLRVPLHQQSVECQPEGVVPALKVVKTEIGTLQVTVEATKHLGVSRLAPIEDRYEIEIIYVFFGATELSRLYEAEGLVDKLHAKLLPLVAEEFEGKVQEVAA